MHRNGFAHPHGRGSGIDDQLTSSVIICLMPDTKSQPPKFPCHDQLTATGAQSPPDINYTEAQTTAVARDKSFPQMLADQSDPNPPSSRQTPFEVAVAAVERYKGWIDWNDPSDVVKKPLSIAVAMIRILKSGNLIPKFVEYFW